MSSSVVTGQHEDRRKTIEQHAHVRPDPRRQGGHAPARLTCALFPGVRGQAYRIWRAFGLGPHLVQTWKLSADPQFIDKVRDVVGLYLDPPEKALVLAVDEKSQLQALDRTAPYAITPSG